MGVHPVPWSWSPQGELCRLIAAAEGSVSVILIARAFSGLTRQQRPVAPHVGLMNW